MHTAPSTAAAAAASASTAVASGQSHHPNGPISSKQESKLVSSQPADIVDPSQPSPAGPIRIDGFEHDIAVSRSEFLTQPEVLNRRARRLKQLARIYRDHYWVLMEEIKSKHREYYWDYGTSPFVKDEENERMNSTRGDSVSAAAENVNNGNPGVNGGNGVYNPGGRCGVHGCKAKAMALTRFCYMHILADKKQTLYKGCTFVVKGSTSGPIFCGKSVLKSTVPSYCHVHFQKAEKHMIRALKKGGLNISSTNKLAPKFHVLIAEYVNQIQQKRRAAVRANLENAEVKE
ncbi:uncharacterized protein LOC127245087 isoform X2 [Andrographis paniculata]|uniref:uncharacterized protein LOC127245087 isoform X2 n=1 Tax=Andrographis paniculata TaxID=175694 RepID=UPI0021E892D0|nr:uncharacterized protein LOC127245087 isoform X2 [Andrographis paniculata]